MSHPAPARVRTYRVEGGSTSGDKPSPDQAPSGDDSDVLANHWPLFGLTVRTSRLELRLPRDEEIAELASTAGKGVHHNSERPFLTPWTDGDPQDRARFVLQEHWSQLSSWSVSAWRLGLGVFNDKEPLGIITGWKLARRPWRRSRGLRPSAPHAPEVAVTVTHRRGTHRVRRLPPHVWVLTLTFGS